LVEARFDGPRCCLTHDRNRLASHIWTIATPLSAAGRERQTFISVEFNFLAYFRPCMRLIAKDSGVFTSPHQRNRSSLLLSSDGGAPEHGDLRLFFQRIALCWLLGSSQHQDIELWAD
jgi:hypothetical protein